MIKDELKRIMEHHNEILEMIVRDRRLPNAELDAFFLKDCNTLFAMMNLMIDTVEWYGNHARYIVSHLPCDAVGYRGTEIELDKGGRAREALKGFE